MAHTATAFPSDLNTLTVPQLKTLCKQCHLTGYSKLGKAALLSKLTEHHGNTPASTSGDSKKFSAGCVPQVTGGSTAMLSDKSGVVKQGASDGENSTHSLSVAQSVSAGPPKKAVLDMPSPPTLMPKRRLEVDKVSVTGTKRPQSVSTDESDRSLPRRQRFKPLPSALRSYNVPAQPTEANIAIDKSFESDCKNSSGIFSRAVIASTPASGTDKPPSLSIHSSNVTNTSVVRPLSMEVTSTRGVFADRKFKPLNVAKMLPQDKSDSKARVGALQKVQMQLPGPSRIVNSCLPSDLRSLDFPSVPFETLNNITIPPSVSDRRRVGPWSILLSHVSRNDFKSCTLVSRMFRYAVHLSAFSILKREFSGRRTEEVIKNHSQSTTNMWPYLRMRELESTTRKHLYMGSFIGRYYDGLPIISEHLWRSPDDNRQLAIALRFHTTKLWHCLSLDPVAWSYDIVSDVQEVVHGEIWRITTRSEHGESHYYVLEATCEVIGRPNISSPSANTQPYQPQMRLRSDWAAYIENKLQHVSECDLPVLPLWNRIKWVNHEEYHLGISKAWLQRIASEGELGIIKREVAQRYVVACVVGNGISGEWMSARQMAQEFAGLPSMGGATHASKLPQVNLYLPDHHYVESVNFTTARGIRLHSAIAAVQTPGREYMILKDNGMQVGCEEDGIAEVWMRVLGCDSRGVQVQVVPS